MKILLANLPWEKGGYWGVRAGSRWPHIKTAQEKHYLPFPFFLAYAAALLRREGYDVRLVDALAVGMSAGEFLRLVKQEKPDLLVAETSCPSLSSDLDLLKQIPQEVAVALCGPETSIREPHFLSEHSFIRYVFVGEYELTLLDLARCLKAGCEPESVTGLIYQSGGTFRVNPPRPLLENLDELPWPLREGLPMEKYNDTPGGIPAPSAQMWASRGCPYQCLFCIWPQLMYQSRRYRCRSVVDVVNEMEFLVKQGFKSVYFDDDTANIGTLRMMELAREIKSRGLNVPWAMMARADLMDENILRALHASGLAAVKYGVESADQNLLNNIKKGMDLRKAEEMIRFTKSLGIKVHLTFSFGLPGETRETVNKTIALALSLDPDTIQFSINTAFPGTAYFQDLENRGHIVSRNPADYDGYARAMLRTENLSAKELQTAKVKADKAWREHVWRTRHQEAQELGYWGVFWGTVQTVGPVASVAKAVSFLRFNWDVMFKRRDWRYAWLPANLVKLLQMQNVTWQCKYRTVRKHWLNCMGIYHGSRAYKGPDCVQIDLTSNCNNNCISCWCNSPLLEARMYKGTQKYKTIPTQLAVSLIDELAQMGTSELFFSGGGEPFMHRDLLMILEHAKAHGLYCTVNTNFTLMSEASVSRLIELKVDALTVSFWAARPETYVRTHPHKDEATFHRMVCHLKMLNTRKNGAGPVIKIYNVISNLNYHEVEEMVAFAEETGSESVEFTVVDTIPGATDKLLLDAKQRKSVLEQCERILKRQNKVRVLNLEHFMRRLADQRADEAQYDSGLLGKAPCYVGWVFSRIMSNGDVNFCLKAHRIPVGNLYEHSFREIWNSAKQQEFRNKALKSDKNDAFFQFIGNDEKCKVGCYKSCDDLGRNKHAQDQLNSLSLPEKGLLRVLSFFRK